MADILKLKVNNQWVGVQAIKGDPGNAGGFGTPTASADSNVGTPEVIVTASGPDTAKIFDFQFKNIKGATGEEGDPGSEVKFGTDSDIIVEQTTGTVVEANPATTTATLTGIKIGDTSYAVNGGGGTTVIANPTLVGTEADLTGLQVVETKYKVSVTDAALTSAKATGGIGWTEGETTHKINSSYISSGTEASGKVLTADGTGGITWATGGGGTTVEPNPIMSGSEPELTGIKIGSDKFKIVGSDTIVSAIEEEGIGWTKQTNKHSWEGDTTGRTTVDVAGTNFYLMDGTVDKVFSEDQITVLFDIYASVPGEIDSASLPNSIAINDSLMQYPVAILSQGSESIPIGTYFMHKENEVGCRKLSYGSTVISYDGHIGAKPTVDIGGYLFVKVLDTAATESEIQNPVVGIIMTSGAYLTKHDNYVYIQKDSSPVETGIVFTTRDGVVLSHEGTYYTFPTAGMYSRIISDSGMQYYITSASTPLKKYIDYRFIDPDGSPDCVLTISSEGDTSWRMGPPSPPATDGTYVLKCTVTSGTPTYSWVSE